MMANIKTDDLSLDETIGRDEMRHVKGGGDASREELYEIITGKPLERTNPEEGQDSSNNLEIPGDFGPKLA